MRKLLIAAVAAGVAALAVSGLASADPTPEFGAAGAALVLEENVNNPEPVTVVQTEASGAEITTNPVETNPDGTAKYMSQDGGDGETASVAVNHIMRQGVASGDFRSVGLDFGETEQSTSTTTVFWVHVGETRFLLTLEKEGE